jgi:hypothetical protein
MESGWTSIDKAAVDLVLRWMQETTPPTTGRALAEALGMSTDMLYPLLRKETKTPMSLGRFHACIRFFRKKPVEAYTLVAQIAAIYDGDYDMAGTLYAAYRDVRVNEATETLAKAYLDSHNAAAQVYEIADRLKDGKSNSAAIDRIVGSVETED